MKLFASLRSFAFTLSHRAKLESEMDEELCSHIQHRADDLVEHSGLSRAEAERHARIELGSHEKVKEECRETLGTYFLETLLQDIRFGTHMLRKSPGFTAVAVLTVALGVGATSVVFTAIKSVLTDPLPYAQPEELVQIRAEFANSDQLQSHVDWAFWSDAQEISRRTRTLDSIGVYGNAIFDLAGDASAEPEALYGLRVSASLFPTLGVTPMLGRNILPDEDRPGHTNEMILSYGLWTRRFNSDRNVVGRTVNIDGHDCLVIGVMPPEFNFPLRRAIAHAPSPYVEFWAPMHLGPDDARGAFGVVARLRQGVSLPEAAQDLASIGAALGHEFPATNRDHTLRMGFLLDRTVGRAKNALWFLMAASLVFLLIGCANLANLLLARGLIRQREIAIRIALGAGKARILRQLLTESCVLAVLGGVSGYALTVGVWKILPAMAPQSIPRLAAARADWHILAFTLMVSLVTGVLFGMIPALRASWTRKITAHDFGARSGMSGKGNRIRSALVSGEVAVTVALVVIGGQFLGGFVELLRTDPGFQANNILASVVIPAAERYRTPEQRGILYRRFLDSVRALPGVENAGTVDALPFSGENHGGFISGSETEATEPNGQMPAEVDIVSSQYLQTMGVHLVAGRWFREDEVKGSSNAAIVNDVAASRLWPGSSAIDKQICVYCTPENPRNWKRVIGVVSTIRHAAIDGPQLANVYLSAAAFENAAFLVLRTNRPVGDLENPIRRAIAGVDPNQPVFLSVSMRTLIEDSLADRRFIVSLLTVIGCLALLMALAGVYGVTSYIASRRTQEIGIRMTLGASPGNVQFLVFRQSFFAAAMGLAIGLGLTLAMMRVLHGTLAGFEIESLGRTWIAIALVALTAAFACYVPARRATKVDPMLALRHE